MAAQRLSIPADVERLAEVRAFVREVVAELGGSKHAMEDLVQAVDEVTCNVMLHGYKGKPGDIEYEAGLRDGRIEITIFDRAPVFDPTATPEPGAPTPGRLPGTAGVGLLLARTMTDAVRHHVRPGGGNELTLIRSIDDEPTREG
ncbi:MAG TPA: ATP-binding protein [Candidatus Binatia bacterium]|nr:ATP-binding protein [Candidatus Binatia bacterium]